MKKKNVKLVPTEMEELCATIRELVSEGEYDEGMNVICQAMTTHPHAPQPHNLMGIVLERKGEHLTAMKHFRAAWALDPTYLPARHNLNTFGTFLSKGKCAFDEDDVPPPMPNNLEIIYDDRGIGRVVRKR